MGFGIYLRLGGCDCLLPLDGRGSMEINIFERIQLGYYLVAALGILAGMLIMAVATTLQDEPEISDDTDNFEFWIDD